MLMVMQRQQVDIEASCAESVQSADDGEAEVMVFQQVA